MSEFDFDEQYIVDTAKVRLPRSQAEPVVSVVQSISRYRRSLERQLEHMRAEFEAAKRECSRLKAEARMRDL